MIVDSKGNPLRRSVGFAGRLERERSVGSERLVDAVGFKEVPEPWISDEEASKGKATK